MKTNKYDRWLVAALLLGVLLAWLPAGVGATEVFTREAFISSLAGGWTGENNITPLGPMPFALLFEWEDDGTLHAHSALNRETYIDLRFAEDHAPILFRAMDRSRRLPVRTVREPSGRASSKREPERCRSTVPLPE